MWGLAFGHVESTVSFHCFHKTSFTLPLFIWSACTMTGKWTVIHLCVRSLHFENFYDFSFGFWNCSDSVVL
jgi:hypothetical protein